MNRGARGLDFLRALSFGNLCFLAVWAELDRARDPNVCYFFRHPPGPKHFGAVALDTLLVAVLFWAGMRTTRTWRRPAARGLARAAFLAAMVLPACALRTELLFHMSYRWVRWFDGAAILFPLAIVGISIGRVARGARVGEVLADWARLTASVLLVFSPFALLTFGRTMEMVALGEAFEKAPLSRLVATEPHRPRVLWIIFDELDHVAAFDERPADLELPELDRLRSQAVEAVQATSPTDMTLSSLPSLLTGRPVARTAPLTRSELGLVFADGAGAPVAWSEQDNVFRRARALGTNTALVGWYHPYSRVLGDSTTSCAFEPCNHDSSLILMEYNYELSLPEHQLHVFVSALPWGKTIRTQHLLAGWREVRVEGHERLRDLTIRAARDPEIGFVFAHFGVPHLSAIWDRDLGDYRRANDGDYFDNLALVDRTLGQIRGALEEAGLGEETVLLVSSDHHWRQRPGEDHRVPFLFRLARQSQRREYQAPFATVNSQALLLEVLAGRVSTAEEAVDWMSRTSRPDGVARASHDWVGHDPWGPGE